MRLRYEILLHLTASVILFSTLLVLVFRVYLPTASRHGEQVTVPDLSGMHVKELEDFLKVRGLNFRVSADSDFSVDKSPLTVLKQVPTSGAKVKEQRKIVVTLNATYPPLVEMPNLVDGSVKSAQILLRSQKLQLGRIQYVPDLAQNAVIEQYWQSKPIEAATSLPQGSRIDLDVGDGFGKQTFTTPNLLGINAKEAETIIISSGLRVGQKHYRPERKRYIYRKTSEGDSLLIEEKLFAVGLILEQSPKAETWVRIGDYIDIWIAGEEP